MNVLDSGERQRFTTGAQRDTQTGKGRFDLLPAEAVNAVIEHNKEHFEESDSQRIPAEEAKYHMEKAWTVGMDFLAYGGWNDVLEAATHCLLAIEEYTDGKHEGVFTPYAFSELAKLFEAGAIKYDERNWEIGIPLSRFLDSALRHTRKALSGITDEPHMVQAAWNYLCLYQTYLWIDRGVLPLSLQNLPDYRNCSNDPDYTKTPDLDVRKVFA